MEPATAAVGALRPTACSPGVWGAFWSRADAQPPASVPSCRDYTRVERECEVEEDAERDRRVLRCRELRERFRLCDGREPERVSTTSIETREPLLEPHTLAAVSSRWGPALVDAGSSALLPPQAHQRQLSPGRSYRPWHVLADDGSAAGVQGGGVPAADRLPPQVEQAVGDIVQFAEEMQRDLEQQGMKLMRAGVEEQQRKPSFLRRLLGARVELVATPELGGGRLEPH